MAFTDGSSDPDGAIVEWRWDFGDGTKSKERNPAHSYLNAGTYKVTLKVWDDSGAYAVATKEITVGQVESLHPTDELVYEFPLWILVLAGAVILFLFLLLLFWKKRRKREEENIKRGNEG